MEEQDKSAIDRRNMLKRVGTVAAGVGAATAASAIASEPAAAAPGDALVQGANNDIAPTTLSGGTIDTSVLTVANPGNGAPLTVKPLPDDKFPSTTSPTGSVYSDNWGDLYTIGRGAGNAGTPWVADVYSDNWAKITYPITPRRYLVTLGGYTMPDGNDGRHFVVPDSAGYDGSGRLVPKNSNTVPDLVLDFTPWFEYIGFAAIQGTITVLPPAASGWVSLYNSAVWPGTASHSFPAGIVSNNYVQSRLYATQGSQMLLNIKVSTPVALILDIVGFITNNPYRYLHWNGGPAPASANGSKSRFDPNADPAPKLK